MVVVLVEWCSFTNAVTYYSMVAGGKRLGSLTVDDDLRFYIALFSALEQTHCARACDST